MGMLFTKLWQSFWGTQEYKILIVGLNNAGKTTTLYKLYGSFLVRSLLLPSMQ
jgi:GTPase SAR1 family protein